MKISKLLIMLTFLTALSTISTTKSKSKSKWKINLLPNKEYEIENPFPFTFEEKCKFKYENPSDKISLKLIKGKAFSSSGRKLIIIMEFILTQVSIAYDSNLNY